MIEHESKTASAEKSSPVRNGERWSSFAFFIPRIVSFNFSQFNVAEVMRCFHPSLLLFHMSTYTSCTLNLWFFSLWCVSSSLDRQKSQMSLKCSTKNERKNVMCFLMFNVVKFTFFVTNFLFVSLSVLRSREIRHLRNSH